MNDSVAGIEALDERSRQIFRRIVDSYIETGHPVGSRNLSRQLPMKLSPASVRNVMADLEQLGLICAPHTSAGRMPTEQGLRLFVDGLLEVGLPNGEELALIKQQIGPSSQDKSIEDVMAETSELLSGLSKCAGMVLADTQVTRIKHIEFVSLEPRRGLVVLVGEDGNVENRVIDLPDGLPPSALTVASNYLNTHIGGRSLDDARKLIERDLAAGRRELDEVTARVIKAGLAVWSGAKDERKSLIIRGRSNLIEEFDAKEDLERIQQLFDDLEAKKELIQLLGAAERADGVRIFIGSENQLFSLSGSSLIISPFQDKENQIVGVLGVIGPTRLNYARIIPMVNYTAKLMSDMLP